MPTTLQFPSETMTASALRLRVERRIREALGLRWEDAGIRDRFAAVSLAIRDVMIEGLLATEARHRAVRAKRVAYMSAEFLMGRSLGNNLRNLQLHDLAGEALGTLGSSLSDLLEAEPDAALGNGGLGRLAACFLDSLATLGIPAIGYGIRYEHGLFRQSIRDGRQVESPDNWLLEGSPWLLPRPALRVQVPVYGRMLEDQDVNGHHNPMWMDWTTLIGVPYDLPVVGFGGQTIQPLRLFEARSSSVLDMEIFNEGDYLSAVHEQIRIETISKVLYPCDEHEAGQELRLLQEYFFVACAARDMMRDFETTETDYRRFPERYAIQLNDTHPAIMVAELMRILVDEKALPWELAWDITKKSCAYTNHTLLPEALECWPVGLLQKVLPRHCQVLFEINRRFLEAVAARYPEDPDRIHRMSLVEESPRRFRMAHLAILGSHSVNGVSELHTNLLKSTVVRDFASMDPHIFNNKTNGITQRRWLLHANPGLSDWITAAIGSRWITDLSCLTKLRSMSSDLRVGGEFLQIKRRNKIAMSEIIRRETRMSVDPDSLFDVQAKRIHEYKRQLMNLLHVVHLYLRLRNGEVTAAARTVIFAGKAAPGYRRAKEIIELIHRVAAIVDHDVVTRAFLQVVFVPDYRVSIAERLIPSADLSEQISTAGTEASGTGNMKFALNGALTIGTLDGANVEIENEVGRDDIYIFGLRADEVASLHRQHAYRPDLILAAHPGIAEVLSFLRSSTVDPIGRFSGLLDALVSPEDAYVHLADLVPYLAAQSQVISDYARPRSWAAKALRNVAGMGRFSSDRTIQEYARDIWGVRAGL